MMWPVQELREKFPWILVLSNIYMASLVMYTPSSKRLEPHFMTTCVARVWNLGWAVFSGVGAWYTLQTLLIDDVFNTPSSKWLLLFVWTKPLEFIDTFLLMANQRPIPVIHWTHHVITLIYTWLTAIHQVKIIAIFAAMNYAVHAVMYLYYFLVMFDRRICRMSWIVTSLQLLQFVVAIVWTVYKSRELSPLVLCSTLAMYGYYMVAFIPYLTRRWPNGPKVDNSKNE